MRYYNKYVTRFLRIVSPSRCSKNRWMRTVFDVRVHYNMGNTLRGRSRNVVKRLIVNTIRIAIGCGPHWIWQVCRDGLSFIFSVRPAESRRSNIAYTSNIISSAEAFGRGPSRSF